MDTDYAESKDNFTCVYSPARSLDFDPQSFVNVGSFLSAQEIRPMESVYTQTIAEPTRSLSSSPSGGARRSRIRPKTVLIALISLILLLIGTNIYSWKENRAWKSERSALEARIEALQSVSRSSSVHAPDFATPNNACPAELLDSCWFKASDVSPSMLLVKVGLGNCAKDAWVDPIGTAEDAWRSAVDSTVDAMSVVADAVCSDFQELGRELHALGRAAWDFLAG